MKGTAREPSDPASAPRSRTLPPRIGTGASPASAGHQPGHCHDGGLEGRAKCRGCGIIETGGTIATEPKAVPANPLPGRPGTPPVGPSACRAARRVHARPSTSGHRWWACSASQFNDAQHAQQPRPAHQPGKGPGRSAPAPNPGSGRQAASRHLRTLTWIFLVSALSAFCTSEPTAGLRQQRHRHLNRRWWSTQMLQSTGQMKMDAPSAMPAHATGGQSGHHSGRVT
mmetsp:Transcript_16369/g.55070  ORF Transcript_16369/g.55070 Transcript_16369/m.55070 type:complete len:227 (+) Transcript_16369:283-963(+)